MARTAATVRVTGLTQVNRAFKRIESSVVGEVKDELRKLAEPVAADWRGMMGRYAGASTSTIKPYPTMKGVVVRQAQRKKTGQRPDFGAAQMGLAMHALEERHDQIEDEVEDLLDWLGRKEGF
jgi:hypothetical protein